MPNKKELVRKKRHVRIRQRVQGTAERPRLVIRRSLCNLYAQVIDDTANKTLFALSTTDKDVKAKIPTGGNIKAAELMGQVFAIRAKEKGISQIVFDRAGYLYHGRVKSFADALRKGGLEF